MTTRVDITGVFSIPTTTPMNGDTFDSVNVDDYDSVIEHVGGIAVPLMAAIVAEYPDVQKMFSYNAVAYRTDTGWEIYLTEAGIRLTSDASMSEGSITQEPFAGDFGYATLYEPGEVIVPAFWMNFKNTAEDDFSSGGGGSGWIPDDPPPTDTITLSATVTTIDQGYPYIGWDNPEEEGLRISSLYCDLEIGEIELGIHFGDVEHDVPFEVIISSTSFGTKIIELSMVSEGFYYFVSQGFDLDGILGTPGTADITVIVTFE